MDARCERRRGPWLHSWAEESIDGRRPLAWDGERIRRTRS